MRRSGVATTTSTPCVERVDLLLTRRAAVDGEHGAAAGDGDRATSTSATCRASSRVGTSTSAARTARLADLGEAGQQRHAEGERLARTGLGPAADVAAR